MEVIWTFYLWGFVLCWDGWAVGWRSPVLQKEISFLMGAI
jgi:hypothetical protein